MSQLNHKLISRIFLLFFMIGLAYPAISQKRKSKKNILTVYGKFEVDGGSVSGTKIQLLRNDVNISNNVSSGGKFDYDLTFNNEYVLIFSKKGYITKRVYISTDVPERVLNRDNYFPPFKIDITLFKEVEGGDYSIFDDPVAMVIYDKELDDFDFDREYNAEIEEKIKEAEQQQPVVKVDKEAEKSKLYEELIARADRMFDAKSYVDAKSTYKEALKVKPEKQYPKDRIALIDKILADLSKREKQKELDDAYYALIDKADIFFEEKKYPEARSYYVEALEIKPDKQHPKDRIAFIDDFFDRLDAREKAYANAISLGNRLFKEKDYEPSRKAYSSALEIKPEEQYPKDQIKRIDRLLAEQMDAEAKEKAYNEAIAEGDRLFDQKNYVDAKPQYQKASELKPDKRYPKEKIKEIDKILRDIEETLGEYAGTILRADQLFADKQWAEAKKAYKEAIRIKSFEVYPHEQIKKIDDILAKVAQDKERGEAYAEAIAKGDRAFGKEDWVESKEAYFEALKIKPDEAYPTDQIEKIEAILAELSKKKEKENKYNDLLNIADQNYDEEKWTEALVNYKAASELKPSEQYPKDQIKKINKKIQEELARKSQQEIDDKYNEFIRKADQEFDTEKWNDALISYQEALNIKPDERYPKERIETIRRKLETIANQEEIDKRYQEAITKADGLYNTEDWLPALDAYKRALDIKPEEQYPQDRITSINNKLRTLADQKAKDEAYDKTIAKADELFNAEIWDRAKTEYQSALEIKPGEEYPQAQIARINEYQADVAARKAEDDAYREAIAEADRRFSAQQYSRAKDFYQEALGLKPNKEYPQTQIEAIDELLGRIAQQQERDDNYESFIREGDRLYNSKEYKEAKEQYIAALEIKPEKEYPERQIEMINYLLERSKVDGKKQEKLDLAYDEAIKQGDLELDKKEYGIAKHYYRKAYTLKPEKEYPKDKLKEIDSILENLKEEKEPTYVDLKNITSESNEKYIRLQNIEAEDDKKHIELKTPKGSYNSQYEEFVEKADAYYAEGNLSFAKAYYQRAYALKYDGYTASRLKDIDNQIQEQVNTQEDEAYEKLVAEGDKALNSGNVAFARHYYRQAYLIRPSAGLVEKLRSTLRGASQNE